MPFEQNGALLGRRLVSLYTRIAVWFIFIIIVMNVLGVEAVYSCVAPFYAHVALASRWLPVPIIAASLGALASLFLWKRFVPGNARRGCFGTATAVFFLLLAGLITIPTVRFARTRGLNPAEIAGSFGSDLFWQLLPFAVFLGYGAVAVRVLRAESWFNTQPDAKTARRWVAGLVLFAIVFAASVAMMRGGPKTLSQPYERTGYEYVDDIGRGLSIQGLFHDYVKIHPYLSMHAKVHPPGPVVLLWVMSFVVGRTPMALAIATIVAGALGLIPLFLWVRDMTSARVAITCCMVYALMPTVVMFTATSADIIFTPFTLCTLLFFWRALHRRSIGYALAAGAMYAVISLISFSLLTIGAFFGLVGLWRLTNKAYRLAVVQTAVLMLAGFIAVHGAVRLWSGFDYIECFRVSQHQFNEDQRNLDLVTPRYAPWVYRILNPFALAFFAGFPALALFLWRIWRPDHETRILFLLCAAALLVLIFLYLGRGEGERSAMYVMPFLAIPASHLLDAMGKGTRSLAPLAATVCFMAAQCWLMESLLYTFW